MLPTQPVVKAVFFDMRDTLGVEERNGPACPGTNQLLNAVRSVIGLRVGVITNLPLDVPADRGLQLLEASGIGPYLDPAGFVTSHEAGAVKPAPAIYAFAAKKLGLAPAECLYVGESLAEVVGAQAAGMRATTRPIPASRDFPVQLQSVTAPESSRLAERFLATEHQLGQRLVGAAARLRDQLSALPPAGPLPIRAMGLFHWLTKHFLGPYHRRKEEVLLPFALRGSVPPAACALVAAEHEQAKAYVRGLEVAYVRIVSGDRRALEDFSRCLTGLIDLHQEHGDQDEVLACPTDDRTTGTGDALFGELLARIGPPDIDLPQGMVGELEAEVGAGT